MSEKELDLRCVADAALCLVCTEDAEPSGKEEQENEKGQSGEVEHPDLGEPADAEPSDDGDDDSSAPRGEGEVEYTIKFTINPRQYLKRLGIDLPEGDEMDTAVSEDCGVRGQPADDDADEAEQVPAEDATVTPGASFFTRGHGADYVKRHVAATLQQCKAKNPLTCPYHGAQAIGQDLEAELQKHGINSAVDIELTGYDTKSGTLGIVASFKAPAGKAGKQQAEAALTAFGALPGVKLDVDDLISSSGGKKEIPMDIDLLDPNAKAAWTAKGTPIPQAPQQAQPQAPAPKQKAPKQKATPAPQPQPATPPPTPQPAAQAAPAQPPTPPPAPAPVAPPQPAPQPQVSPVPQAGRMHPAVRPPEPPKWNGLVEDDFDFLDKVSTDLAFLAQRVNRNNDNGKPDPGQMAYQNFQAIDAKRLAALAKSDTTGQAQVLQDVYDEAKASEKNGWKDYILKNKWKPSDYNAADPSKSMDTASWKFDRSKCPADPYAAQRKAYNEWQDPAKERQDSIDSITKSIAAATKKDKPALDLAKRQMEDSQKGMSDLEANIGAIDAAIASEKDPNAKKALNDLLGEIESAYAALDKQFKDGKKTYDDWASKQVGMAWGEDCAAIANKLKAQGKYVPPLLLTADAKLANVIKTDTIPRLASEIKQAGGQAQAEKNFSNNIRAMWESDDVEVLCNTNMTALTNWLQPSTGAGQQGKYQGTGLDHDYVRLGQYSFGTTYKNAREQHKYFALFPKGSDGSTCYGNVCVVLNKKKAVGFISGPHSGTRGTGSHGRCAIMPMKPNLSAYWRGNLITQDMSKQKNAGKAVLDEFGAAPEFWAVGDVTRDTIAKIRFLNSSDWTRLQSDKNAVAFLKANGVEVEVNGKTVKL